MQHAFYDIPYKCKSKAFNTVGHEVAGTTTLASPSNEVMCVLPKPLHNSSSNPLKIQRDLNHLDRYIQYGVSTVQRTSLYGFENTEVFAKKHNVVVLFTTGFVQVEYGVGGNPNSSHS